jgi:peptidoglycan/LPS O-acetylase OafA/YrhL
MTALDDAPRTTVRATPRPPARPEPRRGRHEAEGRRSGFRPDIEGLRAVAILLVVAYHVGLPFVSGGFVGVDVFFVISGFLITGLVLREMQTTGTVSVVSFYARRAKRLLPASAVVLVFVVIASFVVVSKVDRTQVGLDVMAASLFAANWSFGLSAVDYFSAGIPSPVLHFWSLSVEEQFYLVWPWLLLLLTIPARRLGRSLVPPLLIGLAVVAVPSLWWSIQQTESAAGWAYISSLTRAWELAVGGGLAMLVPFLARMPRAVAAMLGWAGLLAIVWAALTYDELTPFPGSAALVPVLGTAALVAAGTRLPDAGASRLMAARPMVHIGGLSYSWYLWHWPPLVLAAVWLGVDELPLPTALLIAVLTYGMAILSKRYVEEPFHHSPVLRRRPERALRLGGICVAAGVVAGFVLWVPGAVAERFAPDASQAPGAQAVLGAPAQVDPTAGAPEVTPTPVASPDAPAFVPALAAVRKDAPAVNADGCNQRYAGVEVPDCVYGVPDAPRTMVLLGDSHAATWFPALEVIAQEQGWRLVSITKHGCTMADVTLWNGAIKRTYTECDEFRANALARIEAESPELVVTANRQDYRVMDGGTRLGPSASAKAIAAGLVRTYAELDRIAGEVLVLQDNPIPGLDRVECLSRNEDDPAACDQALADMQSVPRPEKAAAREAGVTWNPTSWMFCPEKVCSTVIGGVVVWRDDDHATATYTRTLAPYLQRIIDRATQS